MGWECGPGVEPLPSMHKAKGLVLSTTKKTEQSKTDQKACYITLGHNGAVEKFLL